MASSAYLELLRDPRWQRKRLEIFKRDNFACRGCGDHQNQLQVHHKKYDRTKPPWDVGDRFLVTLCDKCHERTTRLRRSANDVLAELAPDQLYFAVDLLTHWTNRGSNPLQYVLACFGRAREGILQRPYSTEASRNLEDVDGMADDIFAALDALAPRSYGEA